jgi:hypothetical protein
MSFMDVAFGAGLFVTIGPSARAWSSDGTSWTAVPGFSGSSIVFAPAP